MTKSIVACVAGALLLAGCGDDHSYPDGFAAQAAREEKDFVQAPTPSGADPDLGTATSAPSAPRAAAGMMGAPRGSDAPPPPDAPEVTPEEQAITVANEVVKELGLPAPAPAEVVDGTAEFQKLAKDPKFDGFRRMCGRYLQLKAALLPYGKKLADGVSTADDRAMHAKIEKAMEAEFPRINRYMWDDRWSESDRAAMGWILNGPFQQKR
jgi:hypothetical protein